NSPKTLIAKWKSRRRLNSVDARRKSDRGSAHGADGDTSGLRERKAAIDAFLVDFGGKADIFLATARAKAKERSHVQKRGRCFSLTLTLTQNRLNGSEQDSS